MKTKRIEKGLTPLTKQFKILIISLKMITIRFN